MFTLKIRDIVAVGRGNMKWENPVSKSPELAQKSLQSQIVELGKSAKSPADFIIKRKELLNAASVEDLKKLKELAIAKKAGRGEYNEKLRADIQDILDTKKTENIVAADKTAAKLANNASELSSSQIREIRAKNAPKPTPSPEVSDAVKEAKVNLDDKSKEIIDKTARASEQEMVTVEKVIALKDNEPLDLQYEKDGKLKASSVVDLLSDLDGMSGVERTNRGWFRRTFFGGSDQKEVVGEQQLKQMLAGKNQAQLDAIYNRVMGTDSGISISENDKKSLKNGENPQNSRFDFDHVTQSKITNFQTELIQQVDVVATISSILLDDKDARTGLRAVLEGKTTELQAALQDPKRMEKFKETLQKNGVLDRDPSFLEKAASILLRIGISAGFSVFSAGVLGGYIEQGKLDVKDGKVKRDWVNLKASKAFGEDGSVSAVASIDLAGARLEGNWNDPEMRISNRVAYVVDAEDKMQASLDLMKKINAQNGAGAQVEEKLSEKEQVKKEKIETLGKAFLDAQEKLIALPDSQARTDAIAKNTMTYLAKVEALQGAKLKGIFAAATISGWMIGLSGARVDTSASFNGAKIGAGVIESEILQPEPITQEQVKKYLDDLGIIETNGVYTKDEKEILSVPDGKKAQWNFQEIVTDRDTIIRAIPGLVDAKTPLKSEIMHLKVANKEARNAYIENNSKEVANFAKKLRLTNAQATQLEYAISQEGYEVATEILQKILKKSKNKTAVGLLTELQKMNTPEDKKAFLDLFLAHTSGSNESREMGAELERGKDIKSALTKYYDRLAKPFAKQYRLQDTQVKEILTKLLPTVDKDHIATLGSQFDKGFTGVVAYNQINAQGGFVAIDKIDHTNARIVGIPSVIADASMEATLKEIIKKNITIEDIRNFQDKNPGLNTMEFEDIKKLMVAGKVSAYLSFEDSAQCFNLGFAVEPGSIDKVTGGDVVEPVNTKGGGTVVGNTEVGVGSAGIGAGMLWKKESNGSNDSNGEQGPGSNPGTGPEQPVITPPPQINE